MPTPEDWLEKHYPISAEEVAKQKGPEFAKRMVEHALVKWQGLLPEILEEHNLELDRYKDVQRKDKPNSHTRTFLVIYGGTCSLCVAYACHTCPITSMQERNCGIKFNNFIDTGDPKPMITLLEKTLEHVESHPELFGSGPNELTRELGD